MSKSISIIAIVLISLTVVAPVAFATSGECSYHGGANCTAGPSSQGYAVCNDGWTSSVLYSQTDECQSSCISPADVASEVQTIQQDANQIIQAIQNGFASILSNDSALSNQAQTDCQSSASRMGFYNTGCTSNGGSNQYALDQAKEQLAISQEQMKGRCLRTANRKRTMCRTSSPADLSSRRNA